MGIDFRIYSGDSLLFGVVAGFDFEEDGDVWALEFGFLIFGIRFWKRLK
jgi:hypothetical protein